MIATTVVATELNDYQCNHSVVSNPFSAKMQTTRPNKQLCWVDQ